MTPAEQSVVDAVSDEYVAGFARLDPMTATYLGIAGHDEEMTDFSPDGYRARADNSRRALLAIGRAEPANDAQRLAKAVFEERIGLELEIHEAGLDIAAFNTVASPVQEIRRVFDFMPTDTPEQWAVISARLAEVPESLLSLRAALEATLATGVAPARRQAYKVAEQCDVWSGATGGTAFFDGLVAGAETAGPALRADLEARARAASAAYTAFAAYLREEFAPKAPERDGAGKDAYQLWSRFHLGTREDLAESYEWGWGEFARIEAEMKVVANRISAGASPAQACELLDRDPRYLVKGTDAFQTWAQELSDAALTDLRGVHFEIPDELMRLECRVAPSGGPSGQFYYAAPTEDFSRPGAMWWGPPSDREEFPVWQHATTVYHEGAPGHHLQVGTAVYRAADLNRFQRLIAFVAGHGEGWALYTEGLMLRLGYLDDDAYLLGMLNAHLRRAARVVLDIGIHLGLRIPAGIGFHEGENWTPELGIEFMTSRTLSDETRGRDEVNRFLGLPGHATSYKLGERHWLEAVEQAKARLGAAFDLKRFHTYALNLGSIGLDELSTQLASFS